MAKEAELWDKVLQATEEYGETSAYTNISRVRWVSYYEICKHFFPKYRNSATPDY